MTIQKMISTLPTSPNEGACYIVEAVSDDPLFTKNTQVLQFIDGSWVGYFPQTVGWHGKLISGNSLPLRDYYGALLKALLIALIYWELTRPLILQTDYQSKA